MIKEPLSTPRCVSCHASVGPSPGWHTCALTAEHLVERLEVELATAVAEGERHKRNAECYACEAGDPDMDGVQDTKLSRAEAEVARFRDEVVPQVEKKRHDALAEVERLRADPGLLLLAATTRAEAAEAKLLDYKAEVAHLRSALQQTSYAATCLQRSLRAWARPITGMGANISSEDRGRWRMALAEYDKAQPLVDAIILARR